MSQVQQVYIHIDMDAYYAQAEAKRLNIDESVPLCARQWNSMLAINYPAREFGVKRGMLSKEVVALNDQILMPHVDTFRVIDGEVVHSTLEDKYKQHNKDVEKVSLQYYRDESKKIFEVIAKYCSVVEKGGTDEAYIQLKESELESIEFSGFEGHLMGSLPIDYALTEWDRQIMKASILTNQLRAAIYNKTRYRCSAGISFNKMLSKLASAVNKPNKQTIILQCMLPNCIRQINVGKLRGFGGKIKNTFKEANIKTIGEAQDLSKEELIKLFPDKHIEIYDKIRGVDDEGVKQVVDLKNKSILSLKNITKTYDRDIANKAMEVIIYDMAMRVSDNYEDTNMVPTSLSLIYYNADLGQHSKGEQIQLQLPIDSFRITLDEKIRSILASVSDKELFPLIHIGMSCKLFKPIEKESNQPSLLKYFKQQELQDQEAKLTQLEHLINPEQYYICHLCEQHIAKLDQLGHDDFHFAQSIDKEVNPNKRKYQAGRQQSQTIPKSKGIQFFFKK